jgi:hypothetical protein
MQLNSFNILNFLSEQGYEYKENNNYIQIAAKWRDGQDRTSVCIYPDTQTVIDFVTGEKMGYKGLIGRILNIKNGDLDNYLVNRKYNLYDPEQAPPKPKIKLPKTFEKNLLDNILPIYDYPKSRGISPETCKRLKCGVVGNVKGKLSNRFCGPIFNSKEEIIGFWGRDLTSKSQRKYILIGTKSFFVYPAFVNLSSIREKKEIYLVESPFDVLTLFECGIDNVLCLFGIEMSLSVLNFLLRINPKTIFISTNNDSINGGSAGNNAAIKLEKRLNKYFDNHCIKVKLPSMYKDWNETLVKNGKDQLIQEIES